MPVTGRAVAQLKVHRDCQLEWQYLGHGFPGQRRFAAGEAMMIQISHCGSESDGGRSHELESKSKD